MIPPRPRVPREQIERAEEEQHAALRHQQRGQRHVNDWDNDAAEVRMKASTITK
jgi:hypothetical protein